MQFSLATPEDSKKILSNASKVKIHLTTGIIEILDKHQDLLGKVGIDLLEIENSEDNKIEKIKFILQDALVIVSNKGLNIDTISETGVYIFAKRVLELTSGLSIEEFSRKVEQKSIKLDSEKQALADANNEIGKVEKIKTRMFMLEDELEFDKKVVSLLKEIKN
jgi:F0F1-type ATP synthase epsilon subunit